MAVFDIQLVPGDLRGHTDIEGNQLYLAPEELRAAVDAGRFDGLNVHVGHSDPLSFAHDPVRIAGTTRDSRWDEDAGTAVITVETSHRLPAGGMLEDFVQHMLLAQSDGRPTATLGLSPEMGVEYGEVDDEGRIPLSLGEVYSLDVVDTPALAGSGFMRQVAQRARGANGDRIIMQATILRADKTRRKAMDEVQGAPGAQEQDVAETGGDVSGMDARLDRLIETVTQLAESTGERLSQMEARIEQIAAGRSTENLEQVDAALEQLEAATRSLRGGVVPVQGEAAPESLDEMLQGEQLLAGLARALHAHEAKEQALRQQTREQETEALLTASGLPEATASKLKALYANNLRRRPA